MTKQPARILRAIAALFLFACGQAATAVPIEVVYRSHDGTASGSFAFEPRQAQDNPGRLTSGRLQVDDRVFESSQLFYEYFPIADSLTVRIAADESALDIGDYLSLRFGNPDGAQLAFPTPGYLSYSFAGVSGFKVGEVTAVPEPLAGGLFGASAIALAWLRRRRTLKPAA